MCTGARACVSQHGTTPLAHGWQGEVFPRWGPAVWPPCHTSLGRLPPSTCCLTLGQGQGQRPAFSLQVLNVGPPPRPILQMGKLRLGGVGTCPGDPRKAEHTAHLCTAPNPGEVQGRCLRQWGRVFSETLEPQPSQCQVASRLFPNPNQHWLPCAEGRVASGSAALGFWTLTVLMGQSERTPEQGPPTRQWMGACLASRFLSHRIRAVPWCCRRTRAHMAAPAAPVGSALPRPALGWRPSAPPLPFLQAWLLQALGSMATSDVHPGTPPHCNSQRPPRAWRGC